jgi:hypothetical protein
MDSSPPIGIGRRRDELTYLPQPGLHPYYSFADGWFALGTSQHVPSIVRPQSLIDRVSVIRRMDARSDAAQSLQAAGTVLSVLVFGTATVSLTRPIITTVESF